MLLTLRQRLFLIVLLSGGLIGCKHFAPPAINPDQVKEIQFVVNATTIAEVQKSSDQESTVYLRGRITNQAPLVGGMAYELQDSTGSIWVVTKEPNPSLGDEVLIKGVLRYQAIRLNSQEQGSVYVEQQQQLQHTPAVKS